ncbi:hypothetical protein ACFX2I_045068 [Malus domestica]
MIELTMAAFLILSSCKGNKLPIASHGGIQLIVEFLDQDYAGGIGVQAKLNSIATLHNLSTCHQTTSLRACREKYRGLILREGAMPGLLQLSMDGTWTAKATAQELLFLLKDCSNYGSRNKQSRNKDIEQIMLVYKCIC